MSIFRYFLVPGFNCVVGVRLTGTHDPAAAAAADDDDDLLLNAFYIIRRPRR
jgi:hypothetical protein